MNAKEAIVYCVFWASFAISVSAAVVSCSNYHQVYDVRKLVVEEGVFNALREDCQKHGGMIYKAWDGKWQCAAGGKP